MQGVAPLVIEFLQEVAGKAAVKGAVNGAADGFMYGETDMIQKEICDLASINKLLTYEKDVINKCKKLVDDYEELFELYNCKLKMEYFWSNFFRGNISLSREPFVNGYEFYVAVSVVRNGKIVRYKDIEGEVDYYEMEFSWMFDQIERKWFKLKMDYIFNGIKEIEEEIVAFKELFVYIKNNNLEIIY